MNKIFSYEGWYYQLFSFLTNLIIISFLFMLSVVSIVLLGPGIIALYQTLNALYQDKEIAVVATFFNSVRKNIKRGLQLLAVLVVISAGVLMTVVTLMNVSVSLGYLAVIVTSFSLVLLAVFLLLYAVLEQDVKTTLKDTLYVILSGFANGIIVFILPALILVLLSKINLFLFLSIGFGVSGYIQIVFLNKVLLEKRNN